MMTGLAGNRIQDRFPLVVNLCAAGTQFDSDWLEDFLESHGPRLAVERIVYLADAHHKKSLEFPSSTAVATRDLIVPALTSPTPHCGMGYIRTPLGRRDLTPEHIESLFSEIASRLQPEQSSTELTDDEVVAILMRGAPWAVERFGLPLDAVDAMEDGGALLERDADFGSGSVDIDELRSLVPAVARRLGRSRLGTVGGGNHFLEMQAVAAVLDPEECAQASIGADQIGFMMHTCATGLGYHVSRLYTNRLQSTTRDRIRFYLAKIPFHLFSCKSWHSLVDRIDLYMKPQEFPAFPAESAEGRRFITAYRAAANFNYANRVAVMAALLDAVKTVFGRETARECRLVTDASHNSIRNEVVAGHPAWVHRHNATRLPMTEDHETLAEAILEPRPTDERVQANQCVPFPGHNCTSSYLCIPGPAAHKTLHSIDHGAGVAVTRSLPSLNGQTPPPDAATLGFGYDPSRGPRRIPHRGDRGVDETLAILGAARVARPIARLTPLAVLKEPRSRRRR